MRTYHKIIAGSALLTALSWMACDNQKISPPKRPATLECKVIDEINDDTKMTLAERDLLGKKRSEETRPDYGLICETGDKKYHIRITNNDAKPLIALKKAIARCDRIRITYDDNTKIWPDGIGTTGSHTVEITQKAPKCVARQEEDGFYTD